ncbi:MAG: TMEM43 family protein [Geminicoccaceae bacterium]
MAKTNKVGLFIFGGLLILGGIGGLFWNEFRSARELDTLGEGARLVETVDDNYLDLALDGRLLHVAGPARTGGDAADPLFNIAATTLRLDRTVEMYQWREIKEGSGDDRRVRYERVWSAKLIPSSGFQSNANHANPETMAVGPETFLPPDPRVGEYRLGEKLLAELKPNGSLTPPETTIEVAGLTFVGHDNWFYSGDPSRARIGDLRVGFRQVETDQVSVVGQLDGEYLRPYQTRNGGTVALIDRGAVSADDMFGEVYARNALITWALRGAGFVALFVGIHLILHRAARLVPLVGAITRKLGTGVAFLLALIIGLSTIALAWAIFRPLFGALVILIAAVGVVTLRYLPKAKADEPSLAGPPPPPAPPA